MKKFLKQICLFLLIIASNSLFIPQSQAKTEEVQSANEHITVIPAKFEIWGNPGQTYSQALRITNEDKEAVLLQLSVESFVSSGEDGSVVLSATNPDTDNDLQKWIMFKQKGMEFQPNESKVVTFNIDIPKDAKSGGKYASIVISTDRIFKTNDKASATAKVVSLVMLSVTGDIVDEASVKSFEASRQFGLKNFDFTIRVKNSGNNHIRPQGSIIITNFWGTTIDEIPLDGESIIPKMTKKMVTEWNPGRALFGRYTATLVTTYGFTKKLTLTETTSFWVMTWQSIVLIIIMLVFLISVIYKYRRIIKLICKRLPIKIFQKIIQILKIKRAA